MAAYVASLWLMTLDVALLARFPFPPQGLFSLFHLHSRPVTCRREKRERPRPIGAAIRIAARLRPSVHWAKLKGAMLTTEVCEGEVWPHFSPAKLTYRYWKGYAGFPTLSYDLDLTCFSRCH
jgi:hypothetical protein